MRVATAMPQHIAGGRNRPECERGDTVSRGRAERSARARASNYLAARAFTFLKSSFEIQRRKERHVAKGGMADISTPSAEASRLNL
eukprot:15466114-Alexandrium_andersonii.AAC.1